MRWIAWTTVVGLLALILNDNEAGAYSTSSTAQGASTAASRRAFLSRSTALVAAGVGSSQIGSGSASAAPEIFTLPCGIKYATLKPPKDNKKPLNGDIVAIEYTGYLTDGTIFGE